MNTVRRSSAFPRTPSAGLSHPADVIVEIIYHYSSREKKIVSTDGNDEGSMQGMVQLVGCLICLNERTQREARDASCTFKSK